MKNINAKRQRGFSLIELMIVVTIIGIVASIAVPNLLASRRAANEGSAQYSLRTLQSAQISYQWSKGNGRYTNIAVLRSENFIDPVLGGNGVVTTTTKSGYNFTTTPLDPDATNPARYFSTGIPTVPTGNFRTGIRRFAMVEDAALRGDANTTTPIPDRATAVNMPPVGN